VLREHHAYGGYRAQFGELFRPAGDGPHPVAVVIHGGFWRARFGRKLMRALCEDLTDRGWAAWNLEYRRLGDGGGWPHTFEDVAAGIDHLVELAPPGAGHPVQGEPGALDLSRVVAIGHSAGGHLAAWAAVRPRLPDGAPGAGPRVRLVAAIAQAGVVDLRLAWQWRLSNGVVRELLGGAPEERADRYEVASPAQLVPLGVPTLLVHGAQDDIVPPAMSRRFADAAREAGDRCDVVVVEGEDHFGHLDPGNRLWQAVVEWLDAAPARA
jgi:acetyl esterase/lipase